MSKKSSASTREFIAPTDALAIPASPQSYWGRVWQRLGRDPTTICFGIVLLLIVLAAMFAPLLAPADPVKTNMLKRLAPIGTPGFPLGADELGRDMLSRLLYGGRISLLMGIAPVLVALIVGGALGVVAGYLGGKANMAIMRVMDVFYAFPAVLLAIGLAGTLGVGLRNIMIAITAILAPQIARIAESATTQVRALDFVEAARASGAPSWTIIRVHVLANVMGPVLVYASTLISVSIIISAGLSFLGFGIKPPTPEWGLMLSTLRQSMWVNPYVAVLPGAMIFITSLCCNMLSDGIRHAMDMRS